MQWTEKCGQWTRQVTSAGLLLSLFAGAAFTLTVTLEPRSTGGPFAAACWLASLLWAMARRQVRK